MNVEELRSFVVLAAHLHFGRASAALHLSQPALTKQIRRLEESLGSALFERGKHGTRLTSFGGRFLAQAKELVGAFDRALEQSRKEAQGHGGRLRIGFGSYTYEIVPRLIVRLRQAEPEIELSMRDMSTSEQIAALQAGQLDLGFTRLPLPAGAKELEAQPVLQGQLALVRPAHGPASKRVTLEDCRDQPFVALSRERSAGLYERVLRLCGRHGFHPRVVQEASELLTAVALVRAGMGYAILPESAWARRYPGVKIQSLREKEAAWTVGAVWRRRDSNPALGRFLELLRAELPRLGRAAAGSRENVSSSRKGEGK